MPGSTKRVPKLLRHHWLEQKKRNGSLVYVCCDCKTWTANLPLYRAERCEAKTILSVINALRWFLNSK